MIELQLKLLGDRVRNQAFFDALKRVIKKGETTISDIGSGTGFLSFLAEQLGAKDCYLYEYDEEILRLSRQIGRANSMKNCHFIHGHSAEVKKPVRTDVVVSETLGNFALEENIIENIEGAKRFLKQGGVVIPCGIEQFIAPVVTPRIWDEINIFDDVEFDLDLSLAKKSVLNNMFVYRIRPDELLQQKNKVAPTLRRGVNDVASLRLGLVGQKWDIIDLTKHNSSIRTGAAKWNIEKDVTVYGFCVWWNCELVPGVNLSTSPFKSPTHWDQIFLPLLQPLRAQKGDSIEITLKSDSRYEVGIRVAWETRLIKNGKKLAACVKMDTNLSP